MVAETGIIIAGTGYAGSAIAQQLTDRRHNAPFVLLDKTHGEMLVDVILSESGVVAGALVARDGAIDVIRTPVVVLATGNIGGLLPGGDWRASGDGLAIAHRAGLPLAKPHVAGDELRASIPCKPDGSTSVQGLFVAGSIGSDRPAPEKLAKAAITVSREGCEPLGPYKVQPAIDAPLPKGFAHDKFERLRTVMVRATQAEMTREKALVELHRLKGEADEFARARVDMEMFSLQNACEVAILLLRTA